MALDSELAVERESVDWEVGPTKDVVRAFMEVLVHPELPYKCSANEPPSEDLHKSIARQMHAVVLLYNYYHRKQKPELEFLDFVAFCKLALSLSPEMASFMKMIHESEAVELNDSEDNLSVTEKAIKDACDISMSLDASKDVPSTEGFSISKVAVLLIDSGSENCLLQFGAVTKGVWSLIEKEVSELSINQAEERACKKRKTSDRSKFLQIGFDAVKDAAGIEVSECVVLESHVVYSLSKEKSATQFYIMKCKQSFDISRSSSFEFLESLQGPFADKFSGSWVATPLVEYHHLLPYAGLISSWLPRKDSCVPIFSDFVPESIKGRDKNETTPSRTRASTLAEYSLGDLEYINQNSTENQTKASPSDRVVYEDGKDSQKKSKCSSGGKAASSIDLVHSTEKKGPAKDERKTRSDILNSSNRRITRASSVNVDKDSETPGKASLSGRSRGQSQSVVRDDDVSTRNVSENPFTGEGEKSTKSNRKSKTISSAQHDADGPEDGVSTKADTADILKSNEDRYREEAIPTESRDVDISSTQNAVIPTESRDVDISSTQNAVIHFEASCKTEVGNAAEDLQNAVALLDRKRQDLYSRLCTMEDTLALYEHFIDRIRDGGEVGLARRCIESLVSGRDLLLLNNEVQVQGIPQPQKQPKFSNTFVPGGSSSQDLEYTCLKNSWRMPRYFIEPADGKFLASVVLYCTSFTLSSKGASESSPREARESAAAQMITKIRALVMEAD